MLWSRSTNRPTEYTDQSYLLEKEITISRNPLDLGL